MAPRSSGRGRWRVPRSRARPGDRAPAQDEVERLHAELARSRRQLAAEEATALEKRLTDVSTFGGECRSCHNAEARAALARRGRSRARDSPCPRYVKASRKAWHVYILRCTDGSLYTARRTASTTASSGTHRATVLALHAVQAFSEPRLRGTRQHGAALRREAALKALTRSDKPALIARRTKRRRTT